MIRTATVTDVTDAGVWVMSAWLTVPTGPLAASGAPIVGDAVLVVRTDDGEMVAVSSRPAALPTTSVKNSVARFDGTDGALQGSGVTIDDSDSLTATRLNMGKGSTEAALYLLATEGSDSSRRWKIYKDTTTEGGDETGSYLVVQARKDDGSGGIAVLMMWRDSGKIRLGAPGPSGGIEMGSSGPTITTGTGAPTHSAPNGSVYQRQDGAASTTLYVRAAGSWSALS